MLSKTTIKNRRKTPDESKEKELKKNAKPILDIDEDKLSTKQKNNEHELPVMASDFSSEKRSFPSTGGNSCHSFFNHYLNDLPFLNDFIFNSIRKSIKKEK